MSDLIYATSEGFDGAIGSVAIFADRPHVLGMIHDEAVRLGFGVGRIGNWDALLTGMDRRLDEIVFLDCPDPDSAQLAALAELDMVAAAHRVPLIVSTTVGSLDAVFGCLDQSGAQILVDPSSAERSMSLARIMLGRPQLRVNELSDENRLLLLRLTEQINNMAARLDSLAPPLDDAAEGKGAFRLESPRQSFSAQMGDRLVRLTKTPLPEPRMVRRIIHQRQMRGKFFNPELFADPAWDMLLDLTAARAEQIRVSVTSLCIASGVPPTTALRWIGQLSEAGLVERLEDESDRRRAFIALTDKAADSMARFFAEIGNSRTRPI